MKNLIRLLFTLYCVAAASDVVLTNVTVNQRDGSKEVNIGFDVFNDAEPYVNISITASNSSGPVHLTALSGLVGERVNTGTNRWIVWDGGADTNGYFGEITFSLQATDEPAYPISRLICYKFLIRNEKAAVNTGNMWIRIPVKQTSHQILRDLVVTHPYDLFEDSNGNQYIHIEQTLAPYAVSIIRIRMFVDLSSDAELISLNPTNYLAPDTFYEYDDPDFVSRAPTFETGDPHTTARNIMNWTKNWVVYEYSPGNIGAVGAIIERKGDGTEMSYLFSALCRAHGIPARVMGGYKTLCNAWITLDSDYKNYAEFFDGERWIFVDVNNNLFNEGASDYIALFEYKEHGPIPYYYRWLTSGDQLKFTLEDP